VLKAAGFEQQLHLDLGHVDIFRNLSRIAGLTNSQEVTFTDLYQRKAIPELAEYVKQVNFGQDFYHLGRYSSDLSTLRQKLSPQVLADKRLQQALDALEQAQSHIKQYWPAINVGVDAAELRGY
ncbi:ATP phosphoribosyltransferase regulatory subunit, partial [Rhizobium hidalgonense]